jgi:hypothetical protein
VAESARFGRGYFRTSGKFLVIGDFPRVVK